MTYLVVLRSLKTNSERIILDTASTLEHAEQRRIDWRKVLGWKNWTVNRRPGLDTLDHLALKVEKE